MTSGSRPLSAFSDDDSLALAASRWVEEEDTINAIHTGIEQLFLTQRDVNVDRSMRKTNSRKTSRTHSAHGALDSSTTTLGERSKLVDLDEFTWVPLESFPVHIPSTQEVNGNKENLAPLIHQGRPPVAGITTSSPTTSRSSHSSFSSNDLSLSNVISEHSYDTPFSTPGSSIEHADNLYPSSARDAIVFPSFDPKYPAPQASSCLNFPVMTEARTHNPVVSDRLETLSTMFAGDDHNSDDDDAGYNSDASTVAGRCSPSVSASVTTTASHQSSSDILRTLGLEITRPRSISETSIFSSALASGKSIKLRHGLHNHTTSFLREGSPLPEDMVHWPTFREVHVKEPRFSPPPPAPVPKDARYVAQARQAHILQQQRAEAGAELEGLRSRTKSDAGLLSTLNNSRRKLRAPGARTGILGFLKRQHL